MTKDQQAKEKRDSRPNLAVEIAGIKLKNPVMPASGTFGYGEEYAPFIDLEKLGAIVTKGLSLRPKAGNPTPRIAETTSGMLNAIGLQNVGVDDFVKYKLPFLREINTPTIVNFFGNTLEDYGEIAKRLSDIPEIAGVELNISCPNVKQGGIVFGTDPKAAAEVVALVRKNLAKPLIVKLTPNVTDITVVARAVAEAGADAISCINTLTGMAVDVKTRRPRLANRTGGLSGPAIRPIAVRLVHQVVQAVRIPVIGVGGIGTQIAFRAWAHGMRVIGVDTDDIPYMPIIEKVVKPDQLQDVLPESDVVFVAAPHTPLSHKMIGPKEFDLMKPDSYFIVVSRGRLYDLDALVKALKSGHLAGAGVDVTDPEPLPKGHPLWKVENVIITPHIAGRSDKDRARMVGTVKENIRRFVEGLPLVNVVDKQKGY